MSHNLKFFVNPLEFRPTPKNDETQPSHFSSKFSEIVVNMSDNTFIYFWASNFLDILIQWSFGLTNNFTSDYNWYNIYVWGKGGSGEQKIIIKERDEILVGAAGAVSQNNQQPHQRNKLQQHCQSLLVPRVAFRQIARKFHQKDQ
jgi:hypothetical protein